MKSLDKANAEYWSDLWTHSPLNPAIDYKSKSATNYTSRILHSIFSKYLEGASGKTLLEIGCGNSAWLSYFANTFGLKVSGIDYSEKGCEQSEKIFERDHVEGKIYFGDFFSPPLEVPHDFDFVYSGGVVEHFEDTSAAVNAFSLYLKKGGIMITTLPNMAGISGLIQKAFNKPVYDTHVPLTKEDIVSAHKKAGLEIIHSQYYASISMYINLESIDGKKVSLLPLKKLITKSLSVFSKGIWKIENTIGFLPTSAFFSPGIVVIAKKI
jgi:cyclopropane fatty-acyl-phospholipid synthase-like methyltransferase